MKRWFKRQSKFDQQLHLRNVFTMIRNIQSQQPTIDTRNSKYKPSRGTFYRQKLQQKQDLLLQQNFNKVRRIQSVQPKIQSFNKKQIRARSLELRKRRKKRVQQQEQKEDKLMIENFKFIRRIQSVQNKIKCWADPIYLKTHIKNTCKTQCTQQNNIASRKINPSIILHQIKIFQMSRYMKRK